MRVKMKVRMACAVRGCHGRCMRIFLVCGWEWVLLSVANLVRVGLDSIYDVLMMMRMLDVAPYLVA